MNRFQQVQGPNFAAALAAQADAGRSISEGLSGIGSGLTKLGERRAARIEAATKLRNEKALEALKLQAFGADEAGLESIAANNSNNPITGLAEFLGSRQGELLDNASTRASTAGEEATTAGTLIDNNQAQFDLDADKDSKALQKTVSQLGLAAEAAAADGNLDLANKYRNQVIEASGGAYGEGATSVSDMIERTLSRGATGQENRTAVSNDVITLAQGREDYYNSVNTNKDEDNRRDFNLATDMRDDARAQRDLSVQDQIKAITNKLVAGNVDAQGAFARMAQAGDLNDEVRVGVASQIQNFLGENSGIQSAINPADTFAAKYGDAENNEAFGIPTQAGSVGEQVSQIEGATDSILSRDQDYVQYREVQELNSEVAKTGGHIKLQDKIRELYPDVNFNTSEERRIRNYANSIGASDSQILSAMKETTDITGFWRGALTFDKKGKRDISVGDVKKSLKRQIDYADSDKRKDVDAVIQRAGDAKEAQSKIEKLSLEVSSIETALARNPEDAHLRSELDKKARQLKIQRLLVHEISSKAISQEDNVSNPIRQSSVLYTGPNYPSQRRPDTGR